MNNKYLTIPNFLTILRILLVPFFIYYSNQHQFVIASLIIVICSITDFLDGYIARKTKMVSELGKKLDPIADKLLQLAICICLLVHVRYSLYLLILFLIKEGVMLLLWLYMNHEGGYMNGAMWFGKISTACFYLTSFLLILLPIKNTFYSDLLILITAILLLFSFILYIKAYYTIIHKLHK